jgi:hypothetical protein
LCMISMFLSRATCLWYIRAYRGGRMSPQGLTCSTRSDVLCLCHCRSFWPRQPRLPSWPSLNLALLSDRIPPRNPRALLFLTTHTDIPPTHLPTIKPQWPPNASPTSSPTSLLAARAPSSKCTRLPIPTSSPDPCPSLSHGKHVADRTSPTAPLRTPMTLSSPSPSGLP